MGSKESVVHRQTRKKMQCQNKKAATERKEKRVISNYNWQEQVITLDKNRNGAVSEQDGSHRAQGDKAKHTQYLQLHSAHDSNHRRKHTQQL